jgi:hypothetical protein
MNIADCWTELGRYDEALIAYQEATTVFESLGDTKSVAMERPKCVDSWEQHRLTRTFEAGGLIDDCATVGQPARAHLAPVVGVPTRRKKKKLPSLCPRADSGADE